MITQFPVTHTIVLVLTIVAIIPLALWKERMADKIAAPLLIPFLYSGAQLAHTRLIVFPSDIWNYRNQFHLITENGLMETIAIIGKDPAFLLIFKGASWIGLDFESTRALIWVFTNLIFMAALAKLSNFRTASLVTLVAQFFIIYDGYTNNTVRQGAAVAVMSLLIAGWLTHEFRARTLIWLGIVCTVIHWTAGLMVAALMILATVRFRLRTIIAAWVACAALYVSNANSILLGGAVKNVNFSSIYGGEATRDLYGVGGNRVDFLVFSAALGAALLIITRLKQVNSLPVRIFLLLNSIFLIFGFIPFSDRIASYSWIIFIPLVTGVVHADRRSMHNDVALDPGETQSHAPRSQVQVGVPA